MFAEFWSNFHGLIQDTQNRSRFDFLLQVHRQFRRCPVEARCRALFGLTWRNSSRRIDLDDSRAIRLAEMKEYLAVTRSDMKAEDIFAEMDKNGDGQVTFGASCVQLHRATLTRLLGRSFCTTALCD
jgi:hypothetical protein